MDDGKEPHASSNRNGSVTFRGPLFVVGMPRSGTKLLRTLLNGHPRIKILEVESEFLPYWVKNWSRYGDLSQWSNFKPFYENCLSLNYFQLRQIEFGSVIDCRTWYEACVNFTPAGVFEALARHDSGCRADDDIWGDKSPSYLCQIALLSTHYPEARFVHIIRDVRDHVISLRRAFGKNLLRAAQRWSDDVSQARLTGTTLNHRYLEIRYEDLVASPETVVPKICSFLDCDYRPEMLMLKQPAERDFEHQRGAGTGQVEILSQNYGKWLNEIDAETCKKIEQIAGSTLRECGYSIPPETKSRRLSKTSLAVRRVLDGFNIVRTNGRFRLPDAIRFCYRAYRTIAQKPF